MKPKTLLILASVRYWEDTEINGVIDTDGSLMPLKSSDGRWAPQVDLASGQICEWPEGMTADIHYKICDAGNYFIKTECGKMLKYKGDYVPDFLDTNEPGYGDYIIWQVDGIGKIDGWKVPTIDLSEWEEVK